MHSDAVSSNRLPLLQTVLGLGWDLGLPGKVGAKEQLILNYISTIGFDCGRTNTSEFKVIEPFSRQNKSDNWEPEIEHKFSRDSDFIISEIALAKPQETMQLSYSVAFMFFHVAPGQLKPNHNYSNFILGNHTMAWPSTQTFWVAPKRVILVTFEVFGIAGWQVPCRTMECKASTF